MVYTDVGKIQYSCHKNKMTGSDRLWRKKSEVLPCKNRNGAMAI